MDRAVNIHYLGHSGFAVECKNNLLIFDYWETGKQLLRPIIDQKGKKIFFFSSHGHHDHYDNVIEEYKKSIKATKHFVGWKNSEKKFIYVEPYKALSANGLEIATLYSNDAGVAFIVQIGDFCIFHGGDLSGWEDETWSSFSSEIDHLKKMNISIDIAFLAVTSFSGVIQKTMVKAAKYFIDEIDPRYFIPMHANSREYLYKEFKSENFLDNDKIICPEYPGDIIKVSSKKR